jgi:maltokinase
VIAERIVAGDLLDERALVDYVSTRRWFGAKAQEVSHARIVEGAVVRSHPPLLVASVAEVRFPPGTHELYQLLLGARPADDGWSSEVIAEVDGWTVYEALADPALARELLHLLRSQATIQAQDGVIEFRQTQGAALAVDLSDPRSLGVEQSNTSVVFGDEYILKAYRRLEAGINPELELVRFLTEREFEHIPALTGWYAYTGAVMELTLGIVQEFVPGGRDGWELALAEIASDPARFRDRLRRLGEVTGAMHGALASDRSDPEFAPEDASAEALALLVATIDEEIDTLFLNLPHQESVAPIAGRGEEVRERLRQISHSGDVGGVIRTHGDYHLGQALWAEDDWLVLDFEGEPARSLTERRRKRSPLRDVAGMLRSFAYAASAAELVNGVAPPAGWEQEAREEFLEGYLASVDRSVLPSSPAAVDRLLAVFELEKAVYELRYELNNRPDWVRIPVAGIARLLDEAL